MDTVVETWAEEATWVEATWAVVVVFKMESCKKLYLPDNSSWSNICQTVWISQQSSDYAAAVCRKDCKVNKDTK